jgi:hypothetical protein
VQTKSGGWITFRHQGIEIEDTICGIVEGSGVPIRVPRQHLDEIRRIVGEEIPPHRLHVLDEERLDTLPPHIHNWGCTKL